MGQDFFLITVQRGRLGLPPALSLSQTNKRRGTAPIEPGKRGAAGGGGGGRRAERRDGRREGGLEGWVQVPLASRREELQGAHQHLPTVQQDHDPAPQNQMCTWKRLHIHSTFN